MSDLERLRAEDRAAWAGDIYLPNYAVVVNTSASRYIPALDAEVDRLRALVNEPPLCSEVEA